MPKGPQGQKRPADVIGAAVMVAKIATGEIEEDIERAVRARPGQGRPEGRHARGKRWPAERSAVAKKAAGARWRG